MKWDTLLEAVTLIAAIVLIWMNEVQYASYLFLGLIYHNTEKIINMLDKK